METITVGTDIEVRERAKSDPENTVPKWSEELLKSFIDSYPTAPKAEILEEFPLSTWGSVKSKAYQLRQEGYDIEFRKIRDRFQLQDRQSLKLSETESVDLARMIDTDGWIIADSRARGIRVGISCTNPSLVEHFKELADIDSGVTERKRSANHRPMYRIAANTNTHVYSILEAVEDDLIVKQSRARIAMAFIENRYATVADSTYNDGRICLTKRERELLDKLSELNTIGVDG